MAISPPLRPNAQRPTPTSNVQCPTFNVQHSAFNQHSLGTNRASASELKRVYPNIIRVGPEGSGVLDEVSEGETTGEWPAYSVDGNGKLGPDIGIVGQGISRINIK